MALLEAKNLCKRFGGLVAVNNVSISVNEGEIYGLIGPNGAGKTTFLNTISGMYIPDSGHIIFDGHDMTGRKPHQFCHRGLARTYQIVRCFPQMTVAENVLIGGIFGAKLHRHDAEKRAREMLDIVEFPLAHDAPVKTLNTMQLKRLSMARALSTGCKMLLLDEVAAGLTPGELGDITRLMFHMRDKMGITIIIVEHLMKLILNISDRIAVLHFGEKLIEGTPDEVVADERVQRAYLGENYPGSKSGRGGMCGGQPTS